MRIPVHVCRLRFIGCVRKWLNSHLVSAPCHCSCWCDCEGTLHGGSASHCVAGAVVGIALEHSSLRAWRFFEPAGARGLSVEEELEIVGWTPATASLEYTVLVAELSGQAVLFWFGLRCRHRSTTCSTRDRHRLARASRRGHCSGPQAVFVSPARKAHSQVLSCRVHRGYALVMRRAASIFAGCSPHAGPLRPASPRRIPGVSGGPSWWHGHSDGTSRFAATAAATSHALHSGLETLVSTVGKLAKPAGGTGGGRTWSSRHGAWRVGRSARHCSCRAVPLARRSPQPPCAIPEAAHSSSAGNADPSMRHGAERGVGSGPESNVVARCRPRLPLLWKNWRRSACQAMAVGLGLRSSTA